MLKMREYRNLRNPILPLDIHIPDSEAHMMPDGKLYIYGSYDSEQNVYCSEEYHVISTTDMENWTIHDISFRAQDISWICSEDSPRYEGIDWYHPTPFLQKMIERIMADWDKNGEKVRNQEGKTEAERSIMLFAPDCIYKDGKYYLYFCLSDNREGVAVSDCPEGPFLDPIQLHCGGIDPAVFVDDDGQAYYYWGQVSSHGVKLNSDMISFPQEDVVDNLLTEESHYFHEGSSVRKIGDTYYYVFADVERGKPTALGYATSKSPLGPFKYQGIIIDNEECDPASWNNHGSIEKINGQWYVFYHRCSRGVEQYRRLCIEPIEIDADGMIEEVKMTSQGLGKPFALGERIMGYQACGVKGTVFIGEADDKEKEAGYAEKLTRISGGDEAVFRYIGSNISWSEIELVYTGGGTVLVVISENTSLLERKTLTASLYIPYSEEKIQTIAEKIEIPAGEYELKLIFKKSKNLEIFAVTLK